MALTFELMPTVLFVLWVLIFIRRNKGKLSLIPPVQDYPKIKSVVNILESVSLFVIAAIVWVILNETLHHVFIQYCEKNAEKAKAERSATSDSLWGWDSWAEEKFDFQIMFPFDGGEEEKVHDECDPGFLTWCVTGIVAVLLLCTTRVEESLLESCYLGAVNASKKVTRRLSKVFGGYLKTGEDLDNLSMDNETVPNDEQEDAIIETDEEGSEILQD